MTFNVNGANATGLVVTGGLVIGTKNVERKYFGYCPRPYPRPIRA